MCIVRSCQGDNPSAGSWSLAGAAIVAELHLLLPSHWLGLLAYTFILLLIYFMSLNLLNVYRFPSPSHKNRTSLHYITLSLDALKTPGTLERLSLQNM